MENFEIILPSPELAPYIKHYWILETDISDSILPVQRIIPQGYVELIFHSGERPMVWKDNIQPALHPQMFLCGQDTGYLHLQPTGRINMLTVVFYPHGSRAFFPLSINELKGQAVSVHDLGEREASELEDKLLSTPDNHTKIGLIEQFLRKRLHSFNEYNHRRIKTAIHTIDQNCGNIRISDLADVTCLSYKQFKRIFTEYVGINPKDFLRVIRFQRALFILQTNPSISISQLAYECGYYDQPHLINEFKKFSGYTPTEYLSVCQPYSDYFS